MSRVGTKRGQWFAMLAKLTSPMESSAAAQAFAAYAPMLASFPDDAFTIASLEHVAANCRHGVPTYADLREHLAAWWRDNRPRPTAILGRDTSIPEPRTEPTDAERAYVRSLVANLTAELHANHAEVYNRAEKPQGAPYKPAPPLTREQLAEHYKRAGISGPKLRE
jgi:hypothetical protein